MDVAVDDDIDHCRGGLVSFDDDGSDHAFILCIVSNTIFVMVDAGNIESDGAHAVGENPESVIGLQAEGDGVVKGFARVAGFSIDAVPSTIIGEGDGFSCLDGEFSRVEFIVVHGNVMVSVALGCRGENTKGQTKKGKQAAHVLADCEW